tara:strand:- start:616 stop:1932 length:1317 start_codon:yes stop_codon:yes gene_type:complete
MRPLFSIIIPFYNSEKYISECINSIIKQKLANLEIILIDDNSIDRSAKIAKSFVKKNNNIKIIQNNRNEGVSVCRNKGIKTARGKYIIFVDSDDFLIRNSLINLANFIKKHDGTDLIIFTNYTRKADGKFFKDKIFLPSKNKIKKAKNILELYKDKPVFHTCWNYIYNRNFILKHKIRFIKNVNIGEDQLLISKVFCCCKKFTFYKKLFYCKRLGVGLLSNKIGYEPCKDFIKVINEMCLYIKEKKLVKEKKQFMLTRIRDPLIEIVPRLILLNHKEIFKLSKLINLNLKNFKILENISQKKNMFFFLKKYGVFNGLKNYKNFIIYKMKLIVEKSKQKEIYVFSKSFFGISIAKVLLRNNYPVKGFFDNSKVLSGKNKSNMKVFAPSILNNKSKKELSKFFFVISNQQKIDIKNIVNQLKKYAISKTQITNIYFSDFV